MKFHKGIESGQYVLIPFTTLIFDYQFYFVFSGNTYYFSLTGHDLLEIGDHDSQSEIHNLCRGVYTAKNVAHALMLQIEYYFNNKNKFQYVSNNAFDCLKSESYVGSWVLQQIEKLQGHGMKDQYVAMVTKLIESKTPA